MAARAIYKAHLQLGKLSLGVKLYSAVSDRKVHFRLLHEPDRQPLKQRLMDPTTGEEVAREQLQWGFATGPERFVVLSADERASLEPTPSRELEVLRFVPRAKVGYQWYRRPYYLGPDGEGAIEPYFALAAALEEQQAVGIVQWVMRKKRYRGALGVQDGYLVLVALKSAEEMIDEAALPRPAGRELDRKELAMAEQLVELLAGEFDAAEFQDEYRLRLQELLSRKAEGKAVSLPKAKPRRAEEKSLAKMLEMSLHKERGRNVA